METYWIPGVNHLGTHGRWAFAEFADAFQIDSAFRAVMQAAIAASKVR
jgi:type III restriction enzyme